MKKYSIAFILLILTVAIEASAQNSCQKMYRIPRNANWRIGITNTTGELTAMDASSEKDLKKNVEELSEGVMTDGVAGEMEADFITDGRVKSLVNVGDYGSGVIQRWGLSRLKNSGLIHMILKLTVSGHVGDTDAERQANAKKWALTDTYDIVAVHADGRQEVLVRQARSKGIVTLQELDLQLVKGEILQMEYRRSGSLGPYGYQEGRIFEITWDGT